MQKQNAEMSATYRVLQLSSFVFMRGPDLIKEKVTQLHLETGPVLFSSTIFVADVSGFSFAW